MEDTDIDGLLTGANGYIIVGGVFPSDLLNLSKEQYVNFFMSTIYPKSFSLLKRILRNV